MKQFFLLILLCPFFALAQSNYKPGYVVTLKGDTVQGLINYKDWGKNPKQISFKADANAKTQTYSVKNTAGFVVKGYEHYTRYTGKISQDAVDVTYLSRGLDSTAKMDTVFLRAISNGKNVTLYEFEDIIKEHYFISPVNGQTTELGYHVYFDINDNSRVIKQRDYTQQLEDLVAKYQPQNSSLIDQIAKTNYTGAELKKIVAAINQSEDGTPVQNADYTARVHHSSRFYIGIGANSSSVYFTGESAYVNADKSNNILPEINLGTDIFFNQSVGNLLLRLNLGFSGDKASLSYNYQSSAAGKDEYSFKQYTASINPQLLYNLVNTDAVKFFVAAGVAANFSVYSGKQYYQTTSAGTTPFTLSIQRGLPLSPQAVYLNVTTKVGFTFNNKFDIYLGYNPPASLDYEGAYSMKISSFHAGISYLFGK